MVSQPKEAETPRVGSLNSVLGRSCPATLPPPPRLQRALGRSSAPSAFRDVLWAVATRWPCHEQLDHCTYIQLSPSPELGLVTRPLRISGKCPSPELSYGQDSCLVASSFPACMPEAGDPPDLPFFSQVTNLNDPSGTRGNHGGGHEGHTGNTTVFPLSLETWWPLSQHPFLPCRTMVWGQVWGLCVRCLFLEQGCQSGSQEQG